MGIPLNPPFLFGIFNEINHPAIFRYPHDYGNHHDYGPIFAQVKSHLRGKRPRDISRAQFAGIPAVPVNKGW